MFGKIDYDPLADALLCEFPVIGKGGGKTICGRWYRNLSKHITSHHKVTTRQYKQLLGLDLTKPLISEGMKDKFRQAVLSQGRQAYMKKGPWTFQKGQNTRQLYNRSIQTKNRLLQSLDKAHKIKKKKSVAKSLIF